MIKKRVRGYRDNFLLNIKELSVFQIFWTIVLLVAIIFFISMIIRVITTSKQNYDTFSNEKISLLELQSKNKQLQDELEYVKSDEYKKLLLRDTLSIGENSENLYRTKDKIEYFDEKFEYLNLKDRVDFREWWFQLIK